MLCCTVDSHYKRTFASIRIVASIGGKWYERSLNGTGTCFACNARLLVSKSLITRVYCIPNPFIDGASAQGRYQRRLSMELRCEAALHASASPRVRLHGCQPAAFGWPTASLAGWKSPVPAEKPQFFRSIGCSNKLGMHIGCMSIQNCRTFQKHRPFPVEWEHISDALIQKLKS